VANSYEHVNEHLGYRKGEEFLDWLGDCQFRRKDSAPWRIMHSFVIR